MCTVWKDKDYQALSLADQGMFAGLLAFPNISWCGVLDYIPDRLRRISNGLTGREFTERISSLISAGFVIVDTETHELLIRRFIRYDGVIKMKNVGKAMATAYEKVLSDYLREVIVGELSRLYGEDPDLHGWEGIGEVDPSLHDEIVSAATC